MVEVLLLGGDKEEGSAGVWNRNLLAVY